MPTLYPKPRPWRLKTHEMLTGERIVTVVDRVGMPVWRQNLFHAYEVRDAGRAYATQKRTMSAIVIAFNWAAEKGIDIEERIAALSEQEELDAIRPDLWGDDIMRILGLPPGREVGAARSFLLELRLDEGPLGADEAERRLREWWAAR